MCGRRSHVLINQSPASDQRRRNSGGESRLVPQIAIGPNMKLSRPPLPHRNVLTEPGTNPAYGAIFPRESAPRGALVLVIAASAGECMKCVEPLSTVMVI